MTEPATEGPRLARLLATWFGAGDLPGAPGTWGSLAAIPFAVIIVLLGGQYLLAVFVLIAFIAGVWASGKLAALPFRGPSTSRDVSIKRTLRASMP